MEGTYNRVWAALKKDVVASEDFAISSKVSFLLSSVQCAVCLVKA